ncbi:hypothetical protein K8R33_02925 [archaeon]|nr:hypothetical protein [archaeon]
MKEKNLLIFTSLVVVIVAVLFFTDLGSIVVGDAFINNYDTELEKTIINYNEDLKVNHDFSLVVYGGNKLNQHGMAFYYIDDVFIQANGLWLDGRENYVLRTHSIDTTGIKKGVHTLKVVTKFAKRDEFGTSTYSRICPGYNQKLTAKFTEDASIHFYSGIPCEYVEFYNLRPEGYFFQIRLKTPISDFSNEFIVLGTGSRIDKQDLIFCVDSCDAGDIDDEIDKNIIIEENPDDVNNPSITKCGYFCRMWNWFLRLFRS